MSSYYPADVMTQMRADSDAAIERLAKWMAKVRVNDDLRAGVDPAVAEARRVNYIASYKQAFQEAE